jgi:hypothetical protein
MMRVGPEEEGDGTNDRGHTRSPPNLDMHGNI